MERKQRRQEQSWAAFVETNVCPCAPVSSHTRLPSARLTTHDFFCRMTAWLAQVPESSRRFLPLLQLCLSLRNAVRSVAAAAAMYVSSICVSPFPVASDAPPI